MAIAVVLVVGQVLVPGRPASSPARSPSPAAAPPAEPPRPASAAPVGEQGASHHSRDTAGARAAAVDFARSYGALVALGEAEAAALKRSMVASAAADDLVAAMQARLAPLRRTWPVGTITYRVAPLAVRATMDGANAATADVWYVGVVSASGRAPYEDWVTQSYRLVWERDGWRIAAESDAPGPRPEPGRQAAASAAELDARLAGFEAVT